MAEFISKLQYKTYEKGEFSDEKARNLEETIQLIKSFPWDEQRGVDIQLTGPSITIQDEYANYLKIGLYSDNLFCVYYLDKEYHLYEYHVPDIGTACKEVTDFFNRVLEISKFDKHLFNIGNQGHFITKSFLYKVSIWKAVGGCLNIIILFAATVFFLIELSPTAPISNKVVLLFLMSVFGGLLAYVLNRYLACINQSIQISKGNNIFFFINGINENKYNKNDIEKITIYQPGGKKKVQYFYAFEIYFKDGSILKFSSMLIPTVEDKFPKDLIRYGNESPFWRI